MFFRVVLFALVLISCNVKMLTENDASSEVEQMILTQVILPSSSTSTQADDTLCLTPVHVGKINPTREEAFDEALEKAEGLPKRSSPCFSSSDHAFVIVQLAQTAIAAMTEVAPHDEEMIQRIKRAKVCLGIEPDAIIAKTATKLIDLYQFLDVEYSSRFREVYRQLDTLESNKETDEMIRQMREALMREALVFMYRYRIDSHPDLDPVIVVYPFDHVNNRIVFAKSIVDRFDAYKLGALPKSFVNDVCRDDACRKELLIYLVSPNIDDDEDYAEALDRRAMTYIQAGYDVTEVNQAAVEDLIESDLFANALAYANKHFDATHAVSTEDRLMKMLRARGCYSVLEDPDGHKLRLFDFTRACASTEEE